MTKISKLLHKDVTFKLWSELGEYVLSSPLQHRNSIKVSEVFLKQYYKHVLISIRYGTAKCYFTKMTKIILRKKGHMFVVYVGSSYLQW